MWHHLQRGYCLSGLRRLAAVTIVVAASLFWFSLYSSLPAYPPGLGWSLAVTAILFLIVLALLHELHRRVWSGLARFGFIVSAIGLATWSAGGIVNTLGVHMDPESVWGRFAQQLIAQPQPGWGLFAAGLIPIGLGAIKSELSLAMRLLLPLGLLFILGVPLKYVLGDRTGGLTVLILFGAGWLTVALLLLSPADEEKADERVD